MIRLAAGLLLALLPLAAEPLAEARQRLQRGNYEEAREAYESLLGDAKTRPAAALGLSRVDEAIGQYDDALAVIDKALADQPKHADLLARRAELLHLRGRWDDALAAAEQAIAGQEEPFLARWVRGCLARDRGDLDAARDEFRWFIRTYSNRSNDDNDIKDGPTLLLVGQAGLENARTNPSLSDQFRFILQEVYGDALKYDRDLWQAEFLAGSLLLEKYNRGEALDAFDKALKINPQAAELHAGKGAAALQNYELKDAETSAERALAINPRLPAALRLKADLQITAGNFPAAQAELAKARAVNPRDESTLARLAACAHLTRQFEQRDALIAEATRFNPKCFRFYHELASVLDDRRFFEDAEGYYLKAIELQPKQPAPRNSLGLLYMRMGREADGQKMLDEAFAADRFNIRVANMRKVLRHLDRYETLKTEHFELRYDPKNDKLLAAYMAPVLEQLYETLANEFGYRPAGPILIEVFNNHEMFSGRTVALPDLHTIGACTGKMVAMVSPQGKGIPSAFNWGRVIRHELVHIFNLAQTHYQVPHWLTEGLAVRQEGFPRPPTWNQLLRERAADGAWLDLDNITTAFVRPKNQKEWHQAYCQSLLYVEYVTTTHGKPAIGQLLDAYRDGLGTDAAIRKVLGVEPAAFEKGYRDYLKTVVAGIKGGEVERDPKTLTQLEADHEKNPDDPDIAARLAEALLKRGKKREARQLVETVLDAKPGHPLASVLKARLLEEAGDTDGAIGVLEKALTDSPDPRVLRALGRSAFEAKQFDKAAKWLEQGRTAEPNDPAWLQDLAKVYGQTGEDAKLAAVLADLAPLDADDVVTRKKLAALLVAAEDWPKAEAAAREALEIDVTDGDVQNLLLEALKQQPAKAEEHARLRTLFAPGKAD